MTPTDPFLSFWIPVGSLVVTALAVFVGPMISLKIARAQLEESRRASVQQQKTTLQVSKESAATTRKSAFQQVVAPMRQAWIDKLRDRVSEFLSISLWFYVSGRDGDKPVDNEDYEEGEDGEAEARVERKLGLLLMQIDLMLNPNEPEHVELVRLLRKVYSTLWRSSGKWIRFPEFYEAAKERCQTVLKYEWEQTKFEVYKP